MNHYPFVLANLRQTLIGLAYTQTEGGVIKRPIINLYSRCSCFKKALLDANAITMVIYTTSIALLKAERLMLVYDCTDSQTASTLAIPERRPDARLSEPEKSVKRLQPKVVAPKPPSALLTRKLWHMAKDLHDESALPLAPSGWSWASSAKNLAGQEHELLSRTSCLEPRQLYHTDQNGLVPGIAGRSWDCITLSLEMPCIICIVSASALAHFMGDTIDWCQREVVGFRRHIRLSAPQRQPDSCSCDAWTSPFSSQNALEVIGHHLL